MSPEQGSDASVSVLVVTPCEEDLESIREALSGGSWRVLGADSEDKALGLLDSLAEFGAAIVDLDATEFDSVQLVHDVAASGRAPVIALTAAGPPAVEKALAAGAVGFVPRPMRPDLVRTWLRAADRLAPGPEGAGKMPVCREVLERFAKLSHDVNNPIQALYATADMLGFKLPPGSKEAERVEKIVAYARQVAELVADASLAAKAQLGPDASSR